MPRRRNIPIDPDISRKDIVDAVERLRKELLDKENPSLRSEINARLDTQDDDSKRFRNLFDNFIEKDYQPFKADYYRLKNRFFGYVAGAAAVAGVTWAIVKIAIKAIFS